MWFYLFILVAGIVGGMVISLRLDGPGTIINDNTRIGKIKQRGQGNSADVTPDPLPGKPLTREERREARLLKRLSRIRARERADKNQSG